MYILESASNIRNQIKEIFKLVVLARRFYAHAQVLEKTSSLKETRS